MKACFLKALERHLERVALRCDQRTTVLRSRPKRTRPLRAFGRDDRQVDQKTQGRSTPQASNLAEYFRVSQKDPMTFRKRG